MFCDLTQHIQYCDITLYLTSKSSRVASASSSISFPLVTFDFPHAVGSDLDGAVEVQRNVFRAGRGRVEGRSVDVPCGGVRGGKRHCGPSICRPRIHGVARDLALTGRISKSVDRRVDVLTDEQGQPAVNLRTGLYASDQKQRREDQGIFHNQPLHVPFFWPDSLSLVQPLNPAKLVPGGLS